MNYIEPNDYKISILLSALGGDFTRVKCLQCGEIDFLVPLDEPFNEAFLANYHCDKCDEAQVAPKTEQVPEL